MFCLGRPKVRCRCCDKVLSDYESRLKDKRGEYLDTCSECLSIINNNLEDNYVEDVNNVYKPIDK